MQHITFRLGFSKTLFMLFTFCYLATAVLVLCLPIHGFIKLFGITLLWFRGQKTLNLHVKRNAKNAIVQVWQNSKGQWGIETRKGYRALGTLKGDSFQSPWLTILRFQCVSRSLDVLIPADALTLSQYQILSARIRFF